MAPVFLVNLSYTILPLTSFPLLVPNLPILLEHTKTFTSCLIPHNVRLNSYKVTVGGVV